uniref:Poly [ADP-ribose] polymerase n=1 Tax=Acrobeloides nanus TaxID=290746 RepID=A0A914E2X6_9BILA
MEIAMNIIKSGENEGKEKDPFDNHYEKLKCAMEVVDKSSDEFKRIQTYLKNTHADTHRSYKLEIIDVFRISREGEDNRFKKDISNHHLLWHGSRTSNFAGILSQGLRIAPPEAPCTGYMFGKGIYFADMVSKSANYCSAYNSDGLLLLCQVALGNIKEEISSRYVEKADKGYHSVKGVGGTRPNPKSTVYDENGVAITLGKPTKSKDNQHRSLLYNEYIVYDEAQVKMRYLIRADFKSTY